MALQAVEVQWVDGRLTLAPLWIAFEALANGRGELVDQTKETAEAVIQAGEAHRAEVKEAILGPERVVPGHYPDPSAGRFGQVSRPFGRFGG